MNTETVLRVARAVCHSDNQYGWPNWDKLTTSERGHYLRRATVAVKATEKPAYGYFGIQLR